MERKLSDKRGQFFIIFAVLLGILILATASVVNLVKSSDNIKSFQAKCDNYKNEVFEISKYAVNNDKNKEFDLINDFSTGFIDYMNDTYNISMCFLYGKITDSHIVNIPGNIIDNPPRTITCDKFIRTYELNEEDSFHFLMVARKNSEMYVCEA